MDGSLAPAPPEIAIGQLYSVVADWERREVEVRGWVITRQGGPEAIRARSSTGAVLPAELVEREDVARAFPAIPGSLRTGFVVRVPEATVQPGLEVDFMLELLRGGHEVARLHIGYREPKDHYPLPSPDFMHRVSNMRQPDYFRVTGLRDLMDFVYWLRRHRDPASVQALLDWGCGCGRLTRHAVDVFPQAEITGTDIDGEAIAWMRANMPRGRYETTGTEPPLPFADRSFDLVIASSVFTHLARVHQQAWLAELRRVLRPGGILLATSHGPHSAAMIGLENVAAQMERDGFVFHTAAEEPVFDKIAGKGYYRAAFETAASVRQHWGRHLTVLEQATGAVNNHQDMNVLRRDG